jgi:hypothetical protein
MAKEIKAGVLVELKDKFTSGIKKAAGASGDFAKQTSAALKQVDGVFSGTAAKLGALGVGLSLGAATRDMIVLDHQMTRMGVTAGISAQKVGKIKQEIYAAALAAKVSEKDVSEAFNVVIERVGDLEYAEENIKSIALTLAATGESASGVGDIFSSLANINLPVDETLRFLDAADAIGKVGAFSLGDFAKKAPAIVAAYGQIGTSAGDLENAMKALQIMMNGIGTPDETVTALTRTINELNTKEDELLKIGIKVRNGNKLRDLNDIMFDVSARIDKDGNAKRFFDIFSIESMKTVLAFNQYGKGMQAQFAQIGDSMGEISRDAATMGKTFQSNLKNMQTAFNRFADANMGKVLAPVTKFLNSMAEDPKRFDATFNAIKRGLIAITVIKVGAGLVSFIESLRKVQSGGPIVPKIGDTAGAAPMPVFVTNWGVGAAGGAPLLTGAGMGMPVPGVGAGAWAPVASGASGSGVPAGGLVGPDGRPVASGTSPASKKWNIKKPNMKGAAKAGVGAAAITAVMAVPSMIGKLSAVSKDEEMTKKEKAAAKGGAIGEAVGSVGGALGGALAGAAIGSVVPVVGTAVGALVGGLIGQFGGLAGRWIGSKIGSAGVTDEPMTPARTTTGAAPATITEEVRQGPRTLVSDDGWTMREASFSKRQLPETITTNNLPAAAVPPVEVGGEIQLHSTLEVRGDVMRLRHKMGRNTTPYKYQTGQTLEALEYA